MELFTAVDDELLWSAASPGLNYLTYNLKREPAYETFRVGILLFYYLAYIYIYFIYSGFHEVHCASRL